MRTIERQRRFRDFAKLPAALALSALFLAGCDNSTPYHEVTVGKNQTLDDIGAAECGPSLLNITVLPRRNHLRMFNGLDGDSVHPGQRLKVPDSLCYDTGDKIR